MKMMKKVMSAAVVAVSIVGCNGQSTGGTELKLAEQNLGPNNELYGSDTLKGALVAANNDSGAGLLYAGTGSSVGETCLRGGGSAVCPNPQQQALAPMSRDLRTPCQPGERSNVIALDAVNVWVNQDNGLTNISRDNVANLFFKTYRRTVNGVVTTINGACWTDWSQVPGSTRTGPITIYRRDDLSGTTEVFKEKVAENTSASFCDGIVTIHDGATSNPAPCTTADSATVCIGKLTASDLIAIGFAGDSAIYPFPPAQPNNLKLDVDGIPSNPSNIRKLITGQPGVYPLARKIFLNENTTSPRSVEEDILYSYIYDTNTEDFEEILEAQGFIACDDSAPLKCGGLNDDGRGAGNCQ
ncbi:substrate-binding domain-containing protein [Myxococcus sp. Y35]|uniref:substrate-binding domain-containing protein n=1 Tax=Pseudomyxococcus flavus TaxID=3115648 RepID=UPI003CF0D5D3